MEDKEKLKYEISRSSKPKSMISSREKVIETITVGDSRDWEKVYETLDKEIYVPNKRMTIISKLAHYNKAPKSKEGKSPFLITLLNFTNIYLESRPIEIPLKLAKEELLKSLEKIKVNK